MIEEIRKAFPDRPPGVVYAFGDTIYNPSGVILSPPLIAHESEHGWRQDHFFDGPEVWWRSYLEDVEFRFREEVQAHAIEYLAQDPRDRNQRAFLLMSTVNRLLAPFYAYGNSITRQDATASLRKAIRGIGKL